MRPVRLQRYLASAGVGSRRRCEGLIRQGKVLVDGRVARVGMSVVPGENRVTFAGKPVQPRPGRVVVALHKPRGYLSACRRGRERGRLVTELVDLGFRLFPAGRLDRDSEGLLVLTDDGELALRLTHPRYGKEKEYEVVLVRQCVPGMTVGLEDGVRVGDGRVQARRAWCVGPRTMRLVVTEGRKRLVRRMFAALGVGVVRLRRVRIAGLRLGDLKPGEWRLLSDAEVSARFGLDLGRGRR